MYSYNIVALSLKCCGSPRENPVAIPILSVEILYFEGNILAYGSMEENFSVRPTNQHFYGYQTKNFPCRPNVYQISFKYCIFTELYGHWRRFFLYRPM